MTTATTIRRQLTQEEIDAMFRPRQSSDQGDEPRAPRYDFLRRDRIPASQLRTIRLLHENFARSLGSSLSAYLRSYVMVNLVSFEQLSYLEFISGMPSPTVVAGMTMRPYEGSGVLEISPNSYFPILEMLLGGSGAKTRMMTREITDIEQRLIEMLLRVMVKDLREAWKNVAPVDFTVQAIEKEPQFLQVVAANEAVIAIGMEIKVGSSTGPLNIAIPSLAIKMMRQQFDQQRVLRHIAHGSADQQKMLDMLGPVHTAIEVSLEGMRISMQDLLRLQAGDLLILDAPVGQPVHCLVNGTTQFTGHVAQDGSKQYVVIDTVAAETK